MRAHRFVTAVAAIAGAAAGLMALLVLFDRRRPEPIPIEAPSPLAGTGPNHAPPAPGDPSVRGPGAVPRPDAQRTRTEPAPARPEAEPPRLDAERGRLVLVSVQTDKTVYELGEAVRIRRVFRNPGSAPVLVSAREWSRRSYANLTVHHSKGSGGYDASPAKPMDAAVEPGAHFDDEVLAEFSDAGDYTIELPPEYLARLGEGGPFRLKISVVDRGNPALLEEKAERIAARIAQEEPGCPSSWSQAHKDLEAMGPRATPHLRRWLRESEFAHLRAVSAKILWFVKGKEGIEDLVGGLKDADAKVRETCLESLRDFREPWTLTAVLPLVGDPDEHVRAEAVWTASEFEDSRVVPALKSALADPDGWVRSQAARHLAEKGDPSGAGILIEVLREDPEDGPGGVVPALERIAGVSFGKAEHPFIHSSMDRIERATRTNKELAARWLEWWEKEGKARFEKK